ncbi:MAG: hypothetical protein ACRDNZ_20305 [Streptosporangiaceae bacterium]
MRTTVTLDDDLAIRLEQLRAERGTSFKDTLNDVIRRGMSVVNAPGQVSSAHAITRPLEMGRRLIDDIDSVPDALAIAEGEAFR